ncbi:hypothetical protein [Mycolicibacterium helvum]|uniref:hypothetical protein n=1 Tax=Mycolicibacterium helvum TaxID=1534349 RepID=UPI0013D09F3C|nr:hypothetical protein [Mycolicibacterium helvum]
MTETPERADEPATSPVATLEPPPPPPAYYGPAPVADRPNRLYQAAAWVAIAAGTIFIVGAVFFTGFALGRHSGHGGGWHQHGGDSQEFHHRGGPGMMPGMGPWGPMGPGGPGGPGPMGPGGPAGPNAGPAGPGGTGPGAAANPTPRP